MLFSLTLPNILSLSRLAFAAAFPFVAQGTPQAIMIGAAGLSDLTDGWIARRFGQRSRAGEILDPITDKLFVLVALVTLTANRQLALWQVLLLLVRDVFNTAGFAWARTRHVPIRFKSRMSGKVVTVLQIVTLLVAILFPRFTNLALAVTVAASLVSIVDYTRAGFRSLREPSAAQ